MVRWPVVAVFALCSLAPAMAAAGSLCGTVRDSQTDAPVVGAGIFLRTPAGAYTGYYGATNASGAYCIHDIPAGTYDLEVRVDDYQVAYVRGVIIGITTDVDIAAGSAALQLARPAPHPASTSTRIAWTLPRASRVRVTILDVHGRLVRGWSAESLPAGAHLVIWNLRDDAGRRLAAGTYFIHLEADGARRVRPIAIVP